MPEIFDIRILSVQDFYLSKQEIVSRFQEKDICRFTDGIFVKFLQLYYYVWAKFPCLRCILTSLA